jgi:hypothetical protein
MKDIDDLIVEIKQITGQHGAENAIKSAISTSLAALHSQGYMAPDMQSSIISFDRNYRQASIALSFANFGKLRRIKEVRHCTPGNPLGLPLGTAFNRNKTSALAYSNSIAGDHFYIENNNLVCVSANPIGQVYVSWYAYPQIADVTQDWIWQRYPDLVKSKVLAKVFGSYGNQAGAAAENADLLPLLKAFIVDNQDTDAENN